MVQWERARYNPRYWERDLPVAVIVRAVRDCIDLDSSNRQAYEAYDFLMDDHLWDMLSISDNCRDAIRDRLTDPADSPTEEGYVQEIMDVFRDPR